MQRAGAISQQFPIFSARLHPFAPPSCTFFRSRAEKTKMWIRIAKGGEGSKKEREITEQKRREHVKVHIYIVNLAKRIVGFAVIVHLFPFASLAFD